MRKLLWLAALVGSAWAQDRPDLNGVWQLDPGHSAFGETRFKAQTLSIKQDDENIKVEDSATEENGKERKGDFECNTNGKECALKMSGQPVKLSAYYNGAVLVVIEVRKSDLTFRKRLKTSEDGKTLTIEIANLSKPGSKPDTLVYTKAAPK